uniref:serine/threonine-protein kinase n=1 Tax=Ornithobacterium rhinotracheale TaxID=28251 RepID=UPI0039A6C570
MTYQEFFERYSYKTRFDKLGGGAFGSVYKAYDNILNKFVAIKIGEIKVIGDKEFSLRDEFVAIKGLPPHPNIANYDEVYTFETPQGIFDYAVIQYYKDGNLSDLIKKDKLNFSEKEDIAMQILEGIGFLHSYGVVHRDIKPSNILIHKHDLTHRIIPKIADFGLSKKSDFDQSSFTNSFGGGTLSYSSPEQLKGQNIHFNTDLWAWAVLVYEIFSGEKLFKPNNLASTAEAEKEVYEKILSEKLNLDNLNLSKKWKDALNLCLIKDNTQRVKSVDEIKRIIGIKNPEKTPTILIDKRKTQIISPNEIKTKITPSSEHPPRERAKKTNYNAILLTTIVCLGITALLYFIFNNENAKKNIDLNTNSFNNSTSIKNEKIDVGEAQEIYRKLHYIDDIQNSNVVEEIFAPNVKVYFDKSNLAVTSIKKNMMDYNTKWKEVYYELKKFKELEKNHFLYSLDYCVKNIKNGDLKCYYIEGELKFNENKKIYYIKDFITKKINIPTNYQKLIEENYENFSNLNKNEKAKYVVENIIGPGWKIEDENDKIISNGDLFFVNELKSKGENPFYIFGDFDADNYQDIAMKIYNGQSSRLIVYNPKKDKVYWWDEEVNGALIEKFSPSLVESYDGSETFFSQSDIISVFYPEISSYSIYWNGNKFSSIWTSD